MSLVSTTFPGSRTCGKCIAVGSGAALRFWIPFFGICLAIYSVEHSFLFSTIAYADGKEEQELVEVVGGSDVIRQASLLGLGLLGASLLLIPTKTQLRVNWWLLGLIAVLSMLLIASTLWAEDSALSLKRSVQPLLLVMAATGVAKHWHPR